MKQGLLLKESPEPHFALYCDNYGSTTKPCNFLFDTITEFENHKLEVHGRIPGKWRGRSVIDRTPSWYDVHYLKTYSKDFIRLRFKLPSRPVRRFNVTHEMLENRRALTPRKCWCGKLKSEWDSKYFQIYC